MSINCKKSCNLCQGHSVAAPREIDLLNFSGCQNVQTRETTNRNPMNVVKFNHVVETQDCGPENIPSNCSQSICFHRQYRSMDGSCNNLRRSLYGAAFTSYIRLLPPLYEDGFNKPVGSVIYRPESRDVTRFLFIHDKDINSRYNQLAMQWGQFLAHDIVANGRFESCQCEMRFANHCQNIYFKRGDPKFGRIPCIKIARSVNKCGTGIFGVPREQLNQATAFIDGSMMYGNNNGNMEGLRSGAFLKSALIRNKEFLLTFPKQHGGIGLRTGDGRADIFVGLATIHTIFLRYHNTLAKQLRFANKRWTGERTFQETRKIIGAIIQKITYSEFLPAILGQDNVDALIPPYTGYKHNVDPTISNEFAAAGFRLHGTIVKHYPLLSANYHIMANNTFVQGVESFVQQFTDKISYVIRGMISVPLKKAQRVNPQVTEKFFGGTVDIPSMNMQRGRDHGMRTYNEYRELCQLDKVKDFSTWDDVSDPEVKKRAANLYKSVDNLDLYTGSMLEEPLYGGVVGPTFACIIAEQFVRLRDGDRFYYENTDLFTPAQIDNINKISMASIICSSEPEIRRVPREAFKTDNGENAINCEDIPQININLWTS
uniref:peroxidase n=1 Tax=Parastrongyloides trichosuri TaxID=131310 RepID=A0A0N4ZCA0_PARTI